MQAALLFIALCGPPLAGASTAVRPNIVVILADDQGWGDLSLHGNKNLKTPRIDSLAATGAAFDRFLVCPLCAPTRAEFFTGRYHSRGGVHGVTTGAERLNLDETTIGDRFRSAGYRTALFGKWHNGTQYPYHPNGRGFEEFYGFCSGHWGNYFDPVLEHNGQLVRGKGFIVDDLTDHALQFIEQSKSEPFFCYLAYNTPHSPFQVPDEYWRRAENRPIESLSDNPAKEDLTTTRCVMAMCENLDWNVGRVLDKLDAMKIADNTIVVYFSDNGPNSLRYNGGMKGRKGTTDEGGVRVPCLVRWPGHIAAGRKIAPIAGAIDLLPTLADMAGIDVGSRKSLDGKSLKPLLCGPAGDWPDRMIFSHNNGKVSVRTQQFRLDAGGNLFDMQADPGQTRDVAAEHPDVAKRLRTAVADWRADVLRDTADDRPFTVGYSQFPTTYLPARDGVATGGIKRSGAAPNCSYYTNWRSTEDRVTWDVEIATSGRYEAVVYYTCPAADVGATIAVSLGKHKATGTIAQAFDPPLWDNMDRVPRRGESYMKLFQPVSLGMLQLEKGRGKLTLQALTLPGKQVADVWAVGLVLKP